MKPRQIIPALFCALLVAYPLSIGPAYLLLQSNDKRSPEAQIAVVAWIDRIYTPMDWCADNSAPSAGLSEPTSCSALV